ncbi:MAG: S8 family peptidase [Cyanobacteriota bacterium]|nr:S8 family peptidase [Cyanobacteriota bacterium]
MLETAGTIDEFYKAVHKIDGLSFLAEFDEEDIPADDNFFVLKNEERHPYRGRVYLMFTNQTAFQQLVRLWKNKDSLPRGYTKWGDVFLLLRDLRFWSVQDRLDETGVLDFWRDRMTWEREHFPCEIELFFYPSVADRLNASAKVRSAVEAAGGSVHYESVITEIRYHALSVRLPVQAVDGLLAGERDLQLIQLENIQFLRATGQMIARCPTSNPQSLPDFFKTSTSPPSSAEPLVALIDGLPLEQHQALAGRLRVDDPDDIEAEYPAEYRRHGTAMASLIIWGDLHRPGEALAQPLYVRPILRPFHPPLNSGEIPEERVADDVLIIDLIHRAVVRILEGEGNEPPAAPSVKVINLSIGIGDRPFLHSLSPLARLLDWLAWKYKVLFIVSAGNVREAIPMDQAWGDLANQPLEEIQQAALKSIAADTRNRRLLSPAETINGLTVAATHHDEGILEVGPYWIDSALAGFPSPYNRHGPGYRRALKPDLLAPGGRAVLRKPVLESQQSLKIVDHSNAPGHCVAGPGAKSGDLNATTKMVGTSNATALMSRAAALLVPILDELRASASEGTSLPQEVPDALWLKALLAHSARWGVAGGHYQQLFETAENKRQLRNQLGRFLGCGLVDSDPILECTATRVTALSGGTLSADAGALHRFPLPPSLSGKQGWRSLAVTLAWFSPIHTLSERWRRAHLWFKPPDSRLKKQLERTGADWQAVQRGTLQHEVFEGEGVSAFVDGDAIIVHVSCREDAKPLTESVPYALAITLEVDPKLGEIYAEVKDRIQIKEKVGVKS